MRNDPKDLKMLMGFLNQLTTPLHRRAYSGICHNVFLLCEKRFDMYPNHVELFVAYEVMMIILQKYFKTWEHYSGDKVYPVEGNCDNYDMQGYNKWDCNTKYGVLRHQLLQHLIDSVNKDLGE